MAIQTIVQLRAKFALESVQNFIKELDEKDKNKELAEWKARANEMPAMIQMNGLGQTCAFYLSKNKGAHLKIYNLLSEWLCKRTNIYQEEGELIEGITKGDMQTYRIAQAEAQAFLVWLKKFSQAYCIDDKE